MLKNRILFFFFIGIMGVVSLISSIKKQCLYSKYRDNGKLVVGEIVSVRKESSQNGISWNATAKYLVEAQEYEVSYEFLFQKLNINDKVDILYLPLHPEDSFFKKELYSKLEIFMLIFYIASSCLLPFGYYLYKKSKKNEYA